MGNTSGGGPSSARGSRHKLNSTLVELSPTYTIALLPAGPPGLGVPGVAKMTATCGDRGRPSLSWVPALAVHTPLAWP